MTDKPNDPGKRNILRTGVALAGGVAVGAAAVPFIKSLGPSASAKAAAVPVDVSLADLQPGEMKRAYWRGMAVFVLHRTPEMLATAAAGPRELKDPDSEIESQQPGYARNSTRSIRPEYLVVMGVCTHLGCAPSLVTDHAYPRIGEWWRGGFYCACHRSTYDYAGRVFAGDTPAPMNLPVPPHHFVDDHTLRIGEAAPG